MSLFVDTNTGNNMAPFAVLYKRYVIARTGSRYCVRPMGGTKNLGYFNSPSQARLFIDQLQGNIPDGMDGLGDSTITPRTAMMIVGGIAAFLFIGHFVIGNYEGIKHID